MCRNLSVIDLNNVKEIKANAFYGCALKSLTIPSSVSFIGLYAFAYNDRLTHTRIPKSVKDIEPMAFHNCTGELHIDCDIPRSRAYKNDRMADSFGGPFYESKFHSIYLSDHVTTLGAGAFEQNYLLEKISFSQHLTKIEYSAMVILGGNENFSNASHPRNAVSPISDIESGKVIVFKVLQLQKAYSLIEVISLLNSNRPTPKE